MFSSDNVRRVGPVHGLLPLAVSILLWGAPQLLAMTDPASPSHSEALKSAADAVKLAPVTTASPTPPSLPAPPDGKWLTDSEGRHYFVDKLSKKIRTVRLDEHHVRTAWGIDIEVVKEDAKFFYYKVYQSNPTQHGPLAGEARETADQKEQIAKAYVTATPSEDRLHFEDYGAGLPRQGQWRNGFVVTDINGDGHPDIFHGPARKGTRRPVVFLGDGHGHWRPWSAAKFPPAPYDYGDVAVADWLGDGHLGFVLGVHLKGLMAFTGDGKGAFKDYSKGLDWETPAKPAVYSSRTVAVLDVNGDGRPDILALGEGPRLSRGSGEEAKLGQSQSWGLVAFLNGADGTWRSQQISDSPRLFGDHIAVGDFNGDGRSDIAVSTGAMGETDLVFLGQADGSFKKQSITGLRPLSYVTAIAAGDFDHDGRADLAVGYLSAEAGVSRTAIDIFYSRPDGSWERRVLAAQEGIETVSALAVGDLDGDKALDLVALTGEGKVWVFRGDGKGFFIRQEKAGLEPLDKDCRGYHVVLADLDGDGRDEIVADFAGEPSPMYAADRCLSGGSLRAWKLVSSPAARPSP